jgi:large subunit ribosomal protein L13
MNCYQAKTGELSRQWYVIDASEQVVGRLAAQIAPILMGKHRPTYTPHIDTGDYVIVTNVDKVVFTGNKWQQKSYQRYSGYPAGQRDEAAWKLFQRRPERILELAIQRMLPKSKLGRQMIDKLKLHVGANHPHRAQQPMSLEPLSGRPAPAGALFAPPPVPRGARKKAGKPAVEAQAAATSDVSPAVVEPPAIVELAPAVVELAPAVVEPPVVVEHDHAVVEPPVVVEHDHAVVESPAVVEHDHALVEPPVVEHDHAVVESPAVDEHDHALVEPPVVVEHDHAVVQQDHAVEPQIPASAEQASDPDGTSPAAE